MMLHLKVKLTKGNTSVIWFEVIINGAGRKKKYEFKQVCIQERLLRLL